MLTPTDHSRDSAGLTYVYPVISRRSGGLSIGVNLNPNNACNWRCVYCQVPDLQRGSAPATDLALLGRELRGFLDEVLHGDFYRRFDVPQEQRGIRDIAISGNGEPTSSAEFDKVIELIGEVSREFGLIPPLDSVPEREGRFKLVLITNGSLVRREVVQRGLLQWGDLGGDVWFKLDSATATGIQRINGVRLAPESVLRNLEAAARLCPTWLQTCLFAFDGEPPSEAERKAYLDFLSKAIGQGIRLQGVLLYGLARPSRQPEASRLSLLSRDWMERFAEDIRKSGLAVRLSL